MSEGPYGPRQGFGGPPPVPPPRPVNPPPAPPDARRAVAVALLNLSGLGLGYALLRRRLPTAACWAATGALLLVAWSAAAGTSAGRPARQPAAWSTRRRTCSSSRRRLPSRASHTARSPGSWPSSKKDRCTVTSLAPLPMPATWSQPA